VTDAPAERATKSFSQIVAELEADGRPVSNSLRQFAQGEQSGDAALLLRFERPSRQRRIELFGEAIDPWNHEEADKERRREGLPPVYFRRMRRLLKTKKAKKWIVLCAQSLVAIALLATGIAYINLYGFRAANLATVQHVQLCRDAAVELEAASSLRNTTIYSDCLAWARGGFGEVAR
jgi:hypothetical protein